jgi:Arc/MetJ family transcription regulator
MKTNVELDDNLLNEVMVISGTYTPEAAINISLQEFIKTSKRKQILQYKGAVVWDGNLNEMRTTRWTASS